MQATSTPLLWEMGENNGHNTTNSHDGLSSRRSFGDGYDSPTKSGSSGAGGERLNEGKRDVGRK